MQVIGDRWEPNPNPGGSCGRDSGNQVTPGSGFLGSLSKVESMVRSLVGRPSWQASEVSAEALAAFKSVIAARQQQTSGS
ncbi:MAG: hypothetical protein HC920_01525 [Oscillatoriales cyanobacterium SM2_3_0]|nr:hypothetical protein [Oscillatoriales cyanobacterium SM2_3_0]